MQTLQLNDYERGYLTCMYDIVVLPDLEAGHDEDWMGVQIGERMFDMNVWVDDITGNVVCTVYECYWMDGNWHTNTKQNGWVITDETR